MNEVTDVGSSHQHARRVVLSHEMALKGRYEDDLMVELGLVDDASSLLLAVMLQVDQRTGTVDLDRAGVPSGDVDTLRLLAQQYIGIRAFRVIRAARAVLSVGYEAEARAHDRILVELQAHRVAIMEDETGKAALDWFKGKLGKGISGRVGQLGSKDLYANLSTDSHGDPAPVARLTDETNTVSINPTRGIASRASLWLYAGFARDQAVVIAASADIGLSGIEDFDNALRRLQESLAEDAP